ncbi:MAG: hypothetical protein KDC09_16230 [Bacteroidales bacterium]|nr:hypothetical protein [Bacteroidales bacterium]
MKTYFLTILLCSFFIASVAQNNVGINTQNPDPSAALDITSSNQGLLPPRVADTNAIASPAEGLMIYDMNAHCMRYFNGTIWSDCMGNVVPNTPWACGNNFIDERDGKLYATTQIGTQCWMAQSLNVGVQVTPGTGQTDNDIIEKFCYDDNAANCDTYGGLYQWDEIMEYTTTEGTQGICPVGWHIPTDNEFCTLENYVDAGTLNCTRITWEGIDAGDHMREAGTNHWLAPNTGADNSTGFRARGAGEYGSSGGYVNLLELVRFQSSTENGSAYRWTRGFSDSESRVLRSAPVKALALSVRCIKD